ncbi:hypothetical protein G7085_07065 [Tessaracoccus sp. HDW20]|uniref:hypothetical protein n=1 Tax=Tessaracoccus coleopterorum TaxID=2714950 RepID=UPI0018D29271|nr:hypothetical protein [Tessaracoccus coleopterorum]NHB84447.1 hypothetical protein [Tessaracoccus coleopterorum]
MRGHRLDVERAPFSTAKIEGYAVRASDLVDEEGNLAEPLRIVDADVERLPEGAAVVVAPGDVLPAGPPPSCPSRSAPSPRAPCASSSASRPATTRAPPVSI